MNENESDPNSAPATDDDLLEAQEGKGYGEDEGERGDAVEGDGADDDEQ